MADHKKIAWQRLCIEAAAIVTFISLIFFTFTSFLIAQRHFKLKLPILKYLKLIIPNMLLIYLSFYLVTNDAIENLVYVLIIVTLAILIPIILKVLKWNNVKELFSIN